MTEKSLSEFVSEWEESGLQFYRECMRITNQFSTKYILEKVLQKQRTHVSRLVSDIREVKLAPVETAIIDNKLRIFLNEELTSEFDRENLNFVEVTELALRMVSFYLDIYVFLKENESQKKLRPFIDHIIESKTVFIEQLKSEFERLNYDRS